MRPSLLLPACLVLSALIHVVLLTAVAIPRQRTSMGQTMTVDLVTPDEVPPGVNSDVPEAPGAAPAPQGTAETVPPPQAPTAPPQQTASNEPPPRREARQSRQRQAAPQQSAQDQATSQQSSQQPQPEQPAPVPTEHPEGNAPIPPDTLADQAERLSAMLNLPGPNTGDGTGTEAINKAKLTREEVAAFRSRLKSCWKLPPGVAVNERLKMVIRLSLRRDGGLASEPALIEGAAANSNAELVKATAVRDEAMRTIRECAPYAMLPPEKYREWRVLDIDFSPDQMSNG